MTTSANSNPRGPSVARVLVTSVMAAVALCAGLSACSNDDAPKVPLSAAGKRGQTVASDKGCRGCHGSDGEGGIGPKWVGLAGSKVKLESGATVTADDAYLRRAITDPSAQKTAGYSTTMPKADLTDAQVDDLIAYIKDLSK